MRKGVTSRHVLPHATEFTTTLTTLAYSNTPLAFFLKLLHCHPEMSQPKTMPEQQQQQLEPFCQTQPPASRSTSTIALPRSFFSLYCSHARHEHETKQKQLFQFPILIYMYMCPNETSNIICPTPDCVLGASHNMLCCYCICWAPWPRQRPGRNFPRRATYSTNAKTGVHQH